MNIPPAVSDSGWLPPGGVEGPGQGGSNGRAREAGCVWQGQAEAGKPGPERLREGQKLAQGHTANQSWRFLAEPRLWSGPLA